MQPLISRVSLRSRLAIRWQPASPVRTAQLVAVGTVALIVAAMYYVGRFASNLPNTDEWDFAGVVVGVPSLSWFLEHHNEHRYPLARLLWWLSVHVSGDFRTPMFLFVALMGGAAALLTDAARRLRGRASLGDLIIPVALLHWGHAFNLLMGYQVAFGLFVVGLAGVCCGVVARRPHLTGCMALVAVQSGGFGLAAAPFLALLLLGNGVRSRPSLAVWPAIIMAYSAWVAATMLPSTVVVPGGVVTGTVCYLSVGLGPVVAQFPKTYWYIGGAVIALAGLMAVASLRTLKGHDGQGFFLVFAAFAATAVAVGFGRGEWALGYRFVSTSALGLALTWVVLGRWVGWIGLPLAVALFVGNLKHAVWYGKLCQGQMRQFETDLRDAKLSPVFLAGKHGNAFHILRPTGLPVLTEFRTGEWSSRYANVPNDPAFELVAAHGPLPCTLFCANDVFLPNGPPIPAIPFASLPTPVVGFRLQGEQLCHIVHQKVRLRWTDANGVSQAADAYPAVMPGNFVVTFPVPGIITDVRLEPATWSAGLQVSSAQWLLAK